MNIKLQNILIGVCGLFFTTSLYAAPTLTTGSGQGRLGETILLPITLNADATNQAMTLTFDVSFVASDVLIGAPAATSIIDSSSIHARYTSANSLRVVIAPLPNLAALSGGVLMNLPVSILRAGTADITSNVNITYSMVNDIPTETGSGELNTTVDLLAQVTNATLDSDDDGLNDLEEIALGLNPDDINDATLDSDGDGIDNITEKTLGTNLFLADTDGDGLSDGFENTYGSDPKVAASVDSLAANTDGDTLTLLQEYMHGTNPNLADTDGDNINDDIEVANGLNPLVHDSGNDPDYDNLSSLVELNTHQTDPTNNDSDADGMDDGFEVAYKGLNPKSATDAYLDSEAADGETNDGLINLAEYNWNSNPNKSDSDGDCMNDGFEVDKGFNPSNSADGQTDKDSDGLINKTECTQGSNLFVADSDGDKMKDGFEYTYGFPFKNATTDASNNGTACTTSTHNNGTGPANDADCDTLTNLAEHDLGLNPKSADTDKDNVNDAVEIAQGRNPAVNEPAILAIISTLLLN